MSSSRPTDRAVRRLESVLAAGFTSVAAVLAVTFAPPTLFGVALLGLAVALPFLTVAWSTRLETAAEDLDDLATDGGPR